MEAKTFVALAEPNRLQIVELLRDGPLSVGQIVDTLALRQPQVSKHLRVLAETGLVSGRRRARQRIYRLEAAPFEELGAWAESFEELWETRLDRLGGYLESADSVAAAGPAREADDQ